MSISLLGQMKWKRACRIAALLLASHLTASLNCRVAFAVDLEPVSDYPSRTWTDNTGRYRVQGRLIAVGRDHIRIFKANNRNSTVPVERLSPLDRRYIADIQRRLAEAADTSNYVDVIHLRIAKELFQRIARRRHRSEYPVNETINGVPLVGTSRSLARTDIRLVPNERQAMLEIPIQGIAKSRTISNVGVARISGQGTTYFEKVIRVSFDDSDFNISSGRLRSSSNSIMTGITTSFNRLLDAIVRRLVARRAGAGKASFDRESERRERARINSTIQERIDAAAGLIDRFIDMSVDAIDKVRNEFQVKARTWTSKEFLFVVLAQSDEIATASVSPPPEIASDVPFAAQVHRSVIPQAITEMDLAESLKPVLQDFIAKHGGKFGNFEERIRSGRLIPSVSDDGQWIIVFWYPPEAPTASTAQRQPQSTPLIHLGSSKDDRRENR